MFPVVPGGKRPAVKAWEQRATTDPDRVRRCWTAGAYNIGVACGPSGLVVIDLDIPKPGRETRPAEWAIKGVNDGADVLAVLCERHRQTDPLATYTVTTGHGGSHLYFTHPEHGPELRNTTGGTPGGLGWLIDTRAHGGYVLAAGSIVNGRPYTVARHNEPAPLPGWLTTTLTPTPLPEQCPVTVDLPADRRGSYLRAAIEREYRHVAEATNGRNRTLYGAAVALGQLVASGDLPAGQVEQQLTAAAHTCGLHLDPPAGQIPKTIRSGLAAGARRPRSVAT